MSNIKRVTVGGIPTARISRQNLAELLLENLKQGENDSKLIFDINGHGLALSRFDAQYRDDLLAADLIHADGQPLVMASRVLTKSPIPERTATTDLFHDVGDAAQRTGSKFFLLGGSEQVVNECARRMKELYPDLIIAGTHHGYFSVNEEQEVCRKINESGADIVWVGLGKPKEQAFCVRNRDNIRGAWLVTCGGCFNYVTGHYPRAPSWMQKSGIEWLHRMLTQPRKLAWRYLSTTPVAIYLLFARTSSDVVEPSSARN
jgi:N-acetylglucosaminyldiphosphoundecaprenol N-acetyl-beta-D-mannosaminyltransferase